MAIPSNFTHFGGDIPDGSEATPGLWDRRFSNLSQNLDQLNSDVSTRQEVFNVKAFGAAGDGVTDDTDAIASAMTAAAQSDSGGVVYFSSGSYRVTSSLVIPTQSGDDLVPLSFNGETQANPNGVLGGFAEGVSAIDFEGSGALFDLRKGSSDNTANFSGSVSNLALHGGGSGTFGIDGANVKTSRFENLMIRGFGEGVRVVSDSFYAMFRNLAVTNGSGVGMRFSGPMNGAVVENCRIGGNGSHGVVLSETDWANQFRGCIIEQNSGAGIRVRDNARQVELYGCHLENNSDAEIEINGLENKVGCFGTYFRPAQGQSAISDSREGTPRIGLYHCKFDSANSVQDIVRATTSTNLRLVSIGDDTSNGTEMNLTSENFDQYTSVIAFESDGAGTQTGATNHIIGRDTKFNMNLGFHGATEISQPTVAGSRSNNTALENLLSALSNYGLIVDNTSDT